VSHIEPYIEADAIAAKTRELGAAISATHRARGTDDPLLLICVLRGSVMFFADLARAIDVDVELEFLAVSSYVGTKSTGEVRLKYDLSTELAGRHVLIVEDIVDTGLTMRYLLNALQARSPASLGVCTLLHKPARQQVELPLDHIGFVIEDRFVVGYGLDLDQLYRNLPFVGIYHADGDG
jgi:hypoxanthine phosphoribosyltransferase